MVAGRRFQFVNEVGGMTGNQVALRYVLDNPEITTAVFGSVDKDHIVENAKAVDIVIPEDIIKRIKQGKRKELRGLDRK